ncbi:MAG: phosphoribosylanthranilate isomerase [Syntrophales bacterium]|nr:phosphoribosylanthranilate isomerase [Syntrophales bacterium]
MVAIKVCGITRLEDALACLSLGVDAIGFIFYPQSLRFITPEEAKKIIHEMEKVGFLSPRERNIFSSRRRPAICGVFVNEDIKKVEAVMSFCGLDFVQFHGTESPQYVKVFPPSKVIKNFPLHNREDLSLLPLYLIHAALIDAYHPHLFGGTGTKADWDLAREAKKYHPIILSGGIKAENVSNAIHIVAPEAIDVNSGVEISPGVKDKKKIEEIVTLAKEL